MTAQLVCRCPYSVQVPLQCAGTQCGLVLEAMGAPPPKHAHPAPQQPAQLTPHAMPQLRPAAARSRWRVHAAAAQELPRACSSQLPAGPAHSCHYTQRGRAAACPAASRMQPPQRTARRAEASEREAPRQHQVERDARRPHVRRTGVGVGVPPGAAAAAADAVIAAAAWPPRGNRRGAAGAAGAAELRCGEAARAAGCSAAIKPASAAVCSTRAAAVAAAEAAAGGAARPTRGPDAAAAATGLAGAEQQLRRHVVQRAHLSATWRRHTCRHSARAHTSARLWPMRTVPRLVVEHAAAGSAVRPHD